MDSFYDVQNAFLEALRDRIPQIVEEQGVPDAQTVLRDKTNGKIKDYVAVQFGDPQMIASGRGVAGVRYDEYELPIYTVSVSAKADFARFIAMKRVLKAVLGDDFDWSGQIRKRPGGALFTMTNSNGATEAYMYPVSFAVTVQASDI